MIMAENYIVRRRQRTTILFGGSEPEQGYKIWFEVIDPPAFDYVEITQGEDNPKAIDAKIQAQVDRIVASFEL